MPKTIRVPGKWQFRSSAIPAIKSLNMPATKGITPWRMSSAEEELRTSWRRKEANESPDEHRYRFVSHGDGCLRANAVKHHCTDTGWKTQSQWHLADLERS